MHRIVVSTLLLAAVLLGCGRGRSKPGAQASAPDVLARVNGVPITRADVEMASRPGGHPGAAPESERSVLENLILQELEAQRARELGLDPGDDYRAEVARMEAALAAFRRRHLAETFRQQTARGVDVSDPALRRYFDENSTRLRTEFHVLQILVHDERTVEEARRDIAAGKDFDVVARSLFPDAPGSAGRFWDLGYLRWSQLPPQWRDSLERMQPGETSDVIRGPKNRFWIVKLLDRRENRELTFENVKPMLAEQVRSESAAAVRSQRVAELRARARIEYVRANAPTN